MAWCLDRCRRRGKGKRSKSGCHTRFSSEQEPESGSESESSSSASDDYDCALEDDWDFAVARPLPASEILAPAANGGSLSLTSPSGSSAVAPRSLNFPSQHGEQDYFPPSAGNQSLLPASVGGVLVPSRNGSLTLSAASRTSEGRGLPSIPVESVVVINRDEGRHRSLERHSTGSSVFTGSFLAAAVAVSPAKVPHDEKPVYTQLLPDITINQLQSALKGEPWLMEAYLRDELHSSDVRSTSWATGGQYGDSQVRRTRFTMPVPSDVPAAVQRLVHIPKTTSAAMLVRLHCAVDTAVLVTNTYTHDTPFGDRYCVEEVVSFSSQHGGVLFCKWAKVKWFTPLPWMYAPVRLALEATTDSMAQENAPKQAQLFADAARRIL